MLKGPGRVADLLPHQLFLNIVLQFLILNFQSESLLQNRVLQRPVVLVQGRFEFKF